MMLIAPNYVAFVCRVRLSLKFTNWRNNRLQQMEIKNPDKISIENTAKTVANYVHIWRAGQNQSNKIMWWKWQNQTYSHFFQGSKKNDQQKKNMTLKGNGINYALTAQIELLLVWSHFEQKKMVARELFGLSFWAERTLQNRIPFWWNIITLNQWTKQLHAHTKQ